ncbi:MAG: hypothetical protein ABIJ84_03265 [bacterium]
MKNYLEIISILVVVAMGFWVYKLYRDKKESDREAEALDKEREELEQAAFAKASACQGGLAEYNQKLQEKKEQMKEKIMELFKGAEKISNKDVTGALDIAAATAVRYLDELEQEGKLKQVGKTGRTVIYTK